MNHDHETENRSRPGSQRGLVLLAFLAFIGFFLFTEHRAHLFGILPYLLLLACPLMHFFMHGRHDGHGQHRNGSSEQT